MMVAIVSKSPVWLRDRDLHTKALHFGCASFQENASTSIAAPSFRLSKAEIDVERQAPTCRLLLRTSGVKPCRCGPGQASFSRPSPTMQPPLD